MNIRRRGVLSGAVQGVGFRPFAARLARAEGLAGYVRNGAGRVRIEVEGSPEGVARFEERVIAEAPSAARVDAATWSDLPAVGASHFEISDSEASEAVALVLPPDLAVCEPCAEEAGTARERRFQYGFGSCTACGPRFTIAGTPPWDRSATAMSRFPVCAECEAEYRDPDDRRYHAQTVACPVCGPRPQFRQGDGEWVVGAGAIRLAVEALRGGRIVALKGIGGFLLLVRADDEAAVSRLRVRKRRPAKPMAVLVRDLDAARELALLRAGEEAALSSSVAPIVLCSPRPGGPVARSVTGDAPRLGIMLPASPLHALVVAGVGVPLVATSANVQDDPLCTTDDEVRRYLCGVPDAVLTHDREILRPCDDSVVDVVDGRMRVLRMARGVAPQAVALGTDRHEPLLALGGHLKVAPALAFEGRAVLWPHVGTLDTVRAREAFTAAVADIQRFFDTRAELLVCDAHPDYATTLWAERDRRPLLRVQHHHAHVAACLAEHGEESSLGFAWDGVGYGGDELLDSDTAAARAPVRLWGGEVLFVDPERAERLHHFLPFPLIGGDAAARDGERALAGMCLAADVPMPGLDRYRPVAHLAPQTTSVGRIFDAVAAATGVCAKSRYEGEAAIRLEALARPGAEPYRFDLSGRTIDWRPMLAELLEEREDGERVASRFHATLIEIVAAISALHRARLVALAGGCFANQLLLRGCTLRLAECGVRAISPISIPVGDGGLAVGQAWVANRRQNCNKRAAHVSSGTR